jgi:hypothetical protein
MSSLSLATSDCELLSLLAARTWSDIRDGSLANIVVGEEAITDYLLLDLHRYSPRLSYLQKWNRHQEATRTGADWDWWFVRPDLSAGVGLRIQAKRLDFFTQRFQRMEHHNRTWRQIDLLQSSAATAGMHALYCLYLATDASPSSADSACGSYPVGAVRPGWPHDPLRLYGCSLAPPAVVRRQLDARDTSLQPLWQFLMPLSCLACCAAWGDNFLERVDAGAARLAGLGASVADEAQNVPTSGGSLITDAIPDEVAMMVRSEGTESSSYPPDVGATLVTVVESGEPA